ncbi:hypothetical protein PVAG01_10504 [Phlyctema vagabunda]|uniref:Uncharacterized protein n=1 Tax=Phlyctema vagabunda TaxID=108571 RepID=A0ABR4P2G7_9HELO
MPLSMWKHILSITSMSSSALNGTASPSPVLGSATIQELRSQWVNPNDVLSVLLIIGGDLVQKALAQSSGGTWTPVCFSFGWVAYSLTAFVGVLGDGRLLPPPDYPAKVYNLKSGYARENQNWVIGRILRDNEIVQSRDHPLRGRAIRISIYEAQSRKDSRLVARFAISRVKLLAMATIMVQMMVAALPFAWYGEWAVLFITAGGTLLACCAGALPQWRAEKLPLFRDSAKDFAVTSGNGSKDIMIVLGCGHSLDLEKFATPETPRSSLMWVGSRLLSTAVYHPRTGRPLLNDGGYEIREAVTVWGIPVGYWITVFMCAVQSLCWLALLISVAGLKSHTWYLLIVGCLGMFQNAAVAGVSRSPDKRFLPLKLVKTVITSKVMDGLMDLEISYPGRAKRLLSEFFPGDLRPDEVAWWNGDRYAYDKKRSHSTR